MPRRKSELNGLALAPSEHAMAVGDVSFHHIDTLHASAAFLPADGASQTRQAYAVIYLAEPPLEGDAALACATSVIADPQPPMRTATGQTSHDERRAQTTLRKPVS